MDDRYQVGQLLEELAFGNIYEAEDTFIQRKVQIFRYLTPTSTDEDQWKESFHSMSAELATVSHPGLPIIYTHGIDDEGPYTIRQLLDSTVVLNTRLAEDGPLSEYEAWELAHQMLEMHDAAKPSGNFHGALDANHIGLTSRPSGKKLYSITDYGLAEIARKMHGNKDYVGAPYLISPEQAKGEPASEISQIYAIGQLIFHALTGGHPLIETPLEEITELQKTSPVRPITDYNSNIPPAMADWLFKLMALAPGERFQTYDEALANLPEPIQSAPVPIKSTTQIPPLATGLVTNTTARTLITGQTSPVTATGAFATQSQTTHSQTARVNHLNATQLQKSKSSSKKPLIIAFIATAVVIIGAVIFFGSGEDDSNYITNEGIDDAYLLSLPREGLLAYIDFDNETLAAKNDDSIKLQALSSSPEFSKSGWNGKGLVLDKTHYYRLSLSGTAMNESSNDFTVSFWVKPHNSSNKELMAASKQPWMDGETEVAQNGSNRHIWKPDNALVVSRIWNMVTMTSSKANDQISIYIDGNLVESSSNSEASEINRNPFIYIGCDPSGKSLHASPSTIDSIAVWDRRLSNSEIKELFKN